MPEAKCRHDRSKGRIVVPVALLPVPKEESHSRQLTPATEPLILDALLDTGFSEFLLLVNPSLVPGYSWKQLGTFDVQTGSGYLTAITHRACLYTRFFEKPRLIELHTPAATISERIVVVSDLPEQPPTLGRGNWSAILGIQSLGRCFKLERSNQHTVLDVNDEYLVPGWSRIPTSLIEKTDKALEIKEQVLLGTG